MPTTPRGYRYPAATDTPDVPRDLQRLATDANADVTTLAGQVTTLDEAVNKAGTGLAAKVASQASSISSLSTSLTGAGGLTEQIGKRVSAFNGAGAAITNLKVYHNSVVKTIGYIYGVPLVLVPLPAGSYRQITAVNGDASGGLAKGHTLFCGGFQGDEAVIWYVGYNGTFPGGQSGVQVRVDYTVVYQ